MLLRRRRAHGNPVRQLGVAILGGALMGCELGAAYELEVPASAEPVRGWALVEQANPDCEPIRRGLLYVTIPLDQELRGCTSDELPTFRWAKAVTVAATGERKALPSSWLRNTCDVTWHGPPTRRFFAVWLGPPEQPISEGVSHAAARYARARDELEVPTK